MNEKESLSINVTIKDVARAAGVSIATVSRILNGKESVSSSMTARVTRAIKELDYQPNAVARALKIRESRSIGLIIPDIENPFFPAVVRGVEDAAQIHRYAVILCNADGRAEEEEKYIKFLVSKQVDGILFTGGSGSEKIAGLLNRLQIPVVLLDRLVPGTQFSAVIADNRRGAYLATEHLIHLGCQRIAYIGGPAGLTSAMDRRQGYLEALKQYGVYYDETLTAAGDFTFDSGFQAVDRLKASGGSFDALFAANDMMAIGAIENLQRKGYKVPEDIAVVGYDGIRMAEWYKPSLSTVLQPSYSMGEQAVRLLVEQLSDNGTKTCVRVLQPELLVRQSSATRGIRNHGTE